MILVIGGKKYPRATVDELSIKHILVLQRELVELSAAGVTSAKTWTDVRALLSEFSRLSEKEQADHPEFLFLISLTIWATRVSAGEEVTLGGALDIPLTSIQFVAEPTDKAPAGKAQPRQTGAPKAKRKK